MLTADRVSAQDISDSKKTRIKRVESLVDSAGDLFKEKDFTGSADKIRDAQKELVRLAEGKNAAVVSELKNDYERIVKAQRLLEGKGESFDSMPSFKSFMSEGSDSKGSGTKDGSDSKGSDSKGSDSKGSDSKGSDSKGSDTKNDVEMVSFTKEVAPILMQHCSQCHIDQKRGQYDMNTYTSIKKGTRKGTAIKPRDLEKSRMIALIENGKMPPRGKGPVPEEQLEVLKNWVAQGAKFDGEGKQKNAKLNSYVSTDGSDSKGSDTKAGSDTKDGSSSSGGLSGVGGAGSPGGN